MTTLLAEPGLTEGERPHDTRASVGPHDVSPELLVSDPRMAIARCARLYGTALTRFCHALLANGSEADEAVQETLLSAYDGAKEFRGDGSVRSWLYGIARRICARRLEIRTRQARRRPLLEAANDESKPVDEAVDDARRSVAVRAALAELRPTEREALLLRFEGDLSFREVGEACGIDEAAARQRVSRALARVRARVAR